MALRKQYQGHDAHQHHSKARIGYTQNGHEERAYEESASARPYQVHAVGEASNAAHPRFVFQIYLRSQRDLETADKSRYDRQDWKDYICPQKIGSAASQRPERPQKDERIYTDSYLSEHKYAKIVFQPAHNPGHYDAPQYQPHHEGG